MKIQCDVCNKEEASVFCSADEAALCSGCDHRVHHANKLASKHHRFSLLNPTNKDAPRCDVCQERRAFLFCREDRAILCRECDGPIHTANEHTQKHNRFLLTGVKLASSASSYPNGNGCDTTTASVDSQQQLMIMKKKDMFVSVTSTPPPSIESTTPTPTPNPSKGGCSTPTPTPTPTTTSAGGSTSSIAEYLIETLPGWHVEDFLDSSSALTHGFCKNDNLLAFLDGEFETTSLANFGGGDDDLGIWVPQAPPPCHQLLHQQKNGASKEMKNLMNKPNSNKRLRMSDHSFTVPQISPPSNKRSTRSFW